MHIASTCSRFLYTGSDRAGVMSVLGQFSHAVACSDSISIHSTIIIILSTPGCASCIQEVTRSRSVWCWASFPCSSMSYGDWHCRCTKCTDKISREGLERMERSSHDFFATLLMYTHVCTYMYADEVADSFLTSLVPRLPPPTGSKLPSLLLDTRLRSARGGSVVTSLYILTRIFSAWLFNGHDRTCTCTCSFNPAAHVYGSKGEMRGSHNYMYIFPSPSSICILTFQEEYKVF